MRSTPPACTCARASEQSTESEAARARRARERVSADSAHRALRARAREAEAPERSKRRGGAPKTGRVQPSKKRKRGDKGRKDPLVNLAAAVHGDKRRRKYTRESQLAKQRDELKQRDLDLQCIDLT